MDAFLWTAGYSFFDSGDVELVGRRPRAWSYTYVGKLVCTAMRGLLGAEIEIQARKFLWLSTEIEVGF